MLLHSELIWLDMYVLICVTYVQEEMLFDVIFFQMEFYSPKILFSNSVFDYKKSQNFGIPALLHRAVVNRTQKFRCTGMVSLPYGIVCYRTVNRDFVLFGGSDLFWHSYGNVPYRSRDSATVRKYNNLKIVVFTLEIFSGFFFKCHHSTVNNVRIFLTP